MIRRVSYRERCQVRASMGSRNHGSGHDRRSRRLHAPPRRRSDSSSAPGRKLRKQRRSRSGRFSSRRASIAFIRSCCRATFWRQTCMVEARVGKSDRRLPAPARRAPRQIHRALHRRRLRHRARRRRALGPERARICATTRRPARSASARTRKPSSSSTGSIASSASGSPRASVSVPVVIYNRLTRAQECRLFMDINTKQRPVPNELLLDIRRLSEVETETEALLHNVFDLFHTRKDSALAGLLSPGRAQEGHDLARDLQRRPALDQGRLRRRAAGGSLRRAQRLSARLPARARAARHRRATSPIRRCSRR